MSEAGIHFRDVHKRYRIYRQRYRSLKSVFLHRRFGEWEDTWALRGVSLDVEPGTTMGLIGPNGAGKSTALKLMAKILLPDQGEIRVRGRVGSLIELGAGFHHEYTGRENVYLNASLLGFSRSEIRRRFDDIVGFAELESHIDDPLRTYSSGMQLRLGFSIAIHIDPEVMLLDEILAVGDESFQRKCFDYMDHFKAEGGTLVLVSHSMESIKRVCAEAAWIEGGRVQKMGPARGVVDAYMNHVYTRSGQLPAERVAGAPEAAIHIGEVRITDGRGRPAETLEAGSDLAVEIGYETDGCVERPVFAATIHGVGGQVIHSTRGGVGGKTPGGRSRAGTATLTYPRLGLLPGLYRISVAVFDTDDPDAPPAEVHVQSYPLQLVPSGGGRGGVERPDQGIVRLDHSWRIGAPPRIADEARPRAARRR